MITSFLGLATASTVKVGSFRVAAGAPPASAGLLLAAKHEPELAVGRARLNQRVAGRRGPGGEVLDRARVGGDHFDQIARLDGLDRLGRLEDGERARETAGVDLCLEFHSSSLSVAG